MSEISARCALELLAAACRSTWPSPSNRPAAASRADTAGLRLAPGGSELVEEVVAWVPLDVAPVVGPVVCPVVGIVVGAVDCPALSGDPLSESVVEPATAGDLSTDVFVPLPGGVALSVAVVAVHAAHQRPIAATTAAIDLMRLCVTSRSIPALGAPTVSDFSRPLPRRSGTISVWHPAVR